MVDISAGKRDALINALATGLDPAAAYVYAGLTPTEIEQISMDDEEQVLIHQYSAQVEHLLLNRMMNISVTQAAKGVEKATAWLLEKMYARYSGKPQATVGDIHIHMDDVDLDHLPTAEVHHDS